MALLCCLGAAPASPAPSPEAVAPGVSYRTIRLDGPHGAVTAHLVTVELGRRPGRGLGLLWPGAVARRETVAGLAKAAGALAAVNGDFFDISEQQHPGVPVTGAPVGPMVVDGRAVKAAVPGGQRFGWPPPPGDSDQDVFGIGDDGLPHLDRLTLDGQVDLPGGDTLPLGGLNQYALPVNGVGAYTPDWGTVSRRRAACGTDTDRGAPCTSRTREVVVRGGEVTATASAPGAGAVPRDAVVLLGRESGADRLRALRVGDAVSVHYTLDSRDGTRFRWALGAEPLIVHGTPVRGLPDGPGAPRTAVGFDASRRVVWLLAVEGREDTGTGVTVAELAAALARVGARDAAYLDGGGSTTLVLSGRVLTPPPPTGPRAVPNGIAIF